MFSIQILCVCVDHRSCFIGSGNDLAPIRRPDVETRLHYRCRSNIRGSRQYQRVVKHLSGSLRRREWRHAGIGPAQCQSRGRWKFQSQFFFSFSIVAEFLISLFWNDRVVTVSLIWVVPIRLRVASKVVRVTRAGRAATANAGPSGRRGRWKSGAVLAPTSTMPPNHSRFYLRCSQRVWPLAKIKKKKNNSWPPVFSMTHSFLLLDPLDRLLFIFY